MIGSNMSFKHFLISFFLLTLIFVGWIYYHSHHRSISSVNIHTPQVSEPLDHLRQTNHLTNFLLLGIGGQGHQGPDLTDTIILISFNHQTHHFTAVTLPRDLWFDPAKAKINTFYSYSLKRYSQDPLQHTQKMMSEIVGLPIHYSLVLDFHGFVNLINLVGGIDVNVKRAFDDYRYPIPGKETAEPESARYEHLHFDAGWQHMNGTLALKFARSRHALGPEGSDFARSQRQEQVIRAFLKKVFSSSTFLNPATLIKLKNQFKNSLVTNLTAKDLPALLKLAFLLKRQTNGLQSVSIVSLLKEPKNLKPYGGQWVVVPKTDWQAIHEYIQQAVNR